MSLRQGSIRPMPDSLILHRWHYRHQFTGKIVSTRYLATEATARERYGDRLIGPVPSTLEVRSVGNLEDMHTSHLMRR